MHTYIHHVHYYETDKMGITHHSNYVRWLEETRMDFLRSIGYGMRRLEAEGVTSPVVSVSCEYKHTTTFEDAIRIDLSIEAYTGVKLVFRYTMTNQKTGVVVLTARSSHCFVDAAGCPVAVKKRFPDFDTALRDAMGKEE